MLSEHIVSKFFNNLKMEIYALMQIDVFRLYALCSFLSFLITFEFIIWRLYL